MWCGHPEEELQRLFRDGRRAYADRRYCGLCGAIVYLDAETEAPRMNGGAPAVRHPFER